MLEAFSVAARAAGRALFGTCVLAAAFASTACDTSCGVGSGEPVRFAGGEVLGELYQTSGWQGPFLYFPADRRIDIEHGLGSSDLEISIYLSFEERESGDGSVNAAPSAGSQAVIKHVDEQRIQVHNNTCAQFYLRLTARSRAASPTITEDSGTGD